MNNDARTVRLAGLGVVLALALAGCGGSGSPFGPAASNAGIAPGAQGATPMGVASNQSDDDAGINSPDFHRRHHHHNHRGFCAAVTAMQNFNGQAIAKRSWMLFTSVTQFPGNQNGAKVQMEDSKIVFSDGLRNYKITGPDMTFTYGTSNLRLRFNGGNKFSKGGWTMKTPMKTAGNDFLDDIVWRVTRPLPGNIHNVTWSAKFYSRSDIQQMHWQWGAANYTRLTNSYNRLGIKPLDDQKYPPYNNDPAGTPERYKGWYNQQGGGTGGPQYTGVGGPTVNVTPCT